MISLFKRRTRFWASSMAVLLVLLILAAFRAGNMLVIDAPEKSDVILVLAGETDHRPARGLQLFDQGYGRKVLIDVPARAEIFGFEETQLAAEYAQKLPDGAAVHICPIEGLSTRDESHDVAKCLNGLESARVLIVTSDFHTRRALSIFRHELRGKSFSVAASYDSTQFGSLWWRNRQWSKTLLEEWMRLIWWNAVDRWR
jgi:uncharacterized SAM-binding protein YcdF (DUF218 family)